MTFKTPMLVLLAALAGCSSTPDAKDSADRCASPAGCGADARATEIGRGDGSASSVAFTEMYLAPGSAKLVDLAFHPVRKSELWVVGYGDNSTHVGTDVESDAPSWKRFVDPAAKHFMHKPPAIAMGEGDTWATCGDNDNSQNGEANDFMGPALFSGDLTVFATRSATGLGSHLDMLHGTPLCRGVAHAGGNWYWAFNAQDQSLDKYNFGGDHGPGNDDHSDGEIYRYAKGQVRGGDDGTPSHAFFDASDGFLYVADTGNQRVVRLDTTKGSRTAALPRNEPLKASGIMGDTSVEVVVDAGVLEKPSGLEMRGGLIYVTDAATSMFHVFDKSGALLRSLATELPPGALAGFTFAADGKIWFTDKVAGRVIRIDPL